MRRGEVLLQVFQLLVIIIECQPSLSSVQERLFLYQVQRGIHLCALQLFVCPLATSTFQLRSTLPRSILFLIVNALPCSPHDSIFLLPVSGRDFAFSSSGLRSLLK